MSLAYTGVWQAILASGNTTGTGSTVVLVPGSSQCVVLWIAVAVFTVVAGWAVFHSFDKDTKNAKTGQTAESDYFRSVGFRIFAGFFGSAVFMAFTYALGQPWVAYNLYNSAIAAGILTVLTAALGAVGLLERFTTYDKPDAANIQVVPYTDAMVQGLSGAAVGALSPAQIAVFTPSQLEGLTVEQVSALTPGQLAALKPAQIPSLARPGSWSNVQIAALSAQQLKALRVEQLNAITMRRFKPFCPPCSAS